MSSLNYTHETLSVSISQAEQLSLALLMLFEQSLDEAQLRTHIQPLLSQLNDDLQGVAFAHRFLMDRGNGVSPC